MSTNHDQPSPHHPTIVESTAAASNFGIRPGNSTTTADSLMTPTNVITQAPQSSRHPEITDLVVLPPVSRRDTTPSLAGLVPSLPETVPSAANFSLPHHSRIDVVPNNTTPSSVTVDNANPNSGIQFATLGKPIATVSYTPAERQDLTRVTAPRSMETSFGGPPVPQNTVEQRSQPLVDGTTHTQVCRLLLLRQPSK